MGAVQRLQQIEDEWMEKATQTSIFAARQVLAEDKGINGRAPVSSLSEVEWGWIVGAIVFAWVRTKSEQAVAEGIGYDQAIVATNHKIQPWDAGAVSSVLPAIADIWGVDWNKPLNDWSRDQIISFSWQIYCLVGAAILARDEGATDKLIQKSKGELDDDIPF